MKKNFLILGLLTTTNLFAAEQFEVFQRKLTLDVAPNPFLAQGPLTPPHASQEKTLQQRQKSLKKKVLALPEKYQERFAQEQGNWNLQREPEEARIVHLEETLGDLEQQNLSEKSLPQGSHRTALSLELEKIAKRETRKLNLTHSEAEEYNKRTQDMNILKGMSNSDIGALEDRVLDDIEARKKSNARQNITSFEQSSRIKDELKDRSKGELAQLMELYPLPYPTSAMRYYEDPVEGEKAIARVKILQQYRELSQPRKNAFSGKIRKKTTEGIFDFIQDLEGNQLEEAYKVMFSLYQEVQQEKGQQERQRLENLEREKLLETRIQKLSPEEHKEYSQKTDISIYQYHQDQGSSADTLNRKEKALNDIEAKRQQSNNQTTQPTSSSQPSSSTQSEPTPTHSTQTTVLEQGPTPFNRKYLLPPPTSAMVYNSRISEDEKNKQLVRTGIVDQYRKLPQADQNKFKTEIRKMKVNIASVQDVMNLDGKDLEQAYDSMYDLYRANELVEKQRNKEREEVENQRKPQSQQNLNASNKKPSFFENIINSISTSIGRFLSYFSWGKR